MCARASVAEAVQKALTDVFDQFPAAEVVVGELEHLLSVAPLAMSRARAAALLREAADKLAGKDFA